MGYFRILAAIPGFFLSALILMLLWNANAHKLFTEAVVKEINYPAAMLFTIILWLAVAPLAAVGKKWW
jgi:branched-subunit amino acid permease